MIIFKCFIKLTTNFKSLYLTWITANIIESDVTAINKEIIGTIKMGRIRKEIFPLIQKYKIRIINAEIKLIKLSSICDSGNISGLIGIFFRT